MKRSINKIFKNLSLFLLFSLLFTTLATLLVIENNISFLKTDNLNNEKNIIASLKNLEKKDFELAQIQFNGKSTQLHYEISKLRTLYQFDVIGKYILLNEKEYLSDLDTLSTLMTDFNLKAGNYFKPDIENEVLKKEELDQAFDTIYAHINSLIFKNIDYDKQKFLIIEKAALVSFVLLFIFTFWYRKRLKLIYRDIHFLYSIENNKNRHNIFSEEVDAIMLRMKRKPVITDNPDMTDPLTEINNVKGMIKSYGDKMGMRDNNFTSVTIIEIDNFSKTDRAFSQDFAQSVLKKVAFTLSLYEQSTDVIARTDYNQFTIILSRESKEQSFKEIDTIRQSISELKLKTPDKESIQITVTGGYIIKPNNMILEEAIKQAKEILRYAKSTTKNRILQKTDVE